jgi:threonine aldolase
MNFISDNAYGASPQILASLTAANSGTETSYGEDTVTARVAEKLAAIFAHEVAVFPVVTGTAANALALAALCPPYGAVFCHKDSHIAVDECAAPEFFTGGAKLAQLDGDGAKLAPQTIAQTLARFGGGVHSPKPSVVSITQATELGTIYKTGEIKAIADVAHKHGMTLHMDGARFANALVSLGCTPAEMTWKASVDALSFGATKNGALCAEALVVLDPAKAGDIPFIRKRAAQLFSKSRFIAAQFQAYFEGGLWLETARHSNAMATRLAGHIEASGKVKLAWKPEANEVFGIMTKEAADALQAKGAVFHPWKPPHGFAGGVGEGETLCRFVTSFATSEEEVDRFGELIA